MGALGAARITPAALIRPARAVTGVAVDAVAARDVARAQAFADRHRIPRVHRSYEALIEDPELDALYNPLPNGLHCEWTVRALEAGLHVLCEKPIAANEAEAQRMADAAAANGRVLVEAFHWRYHPLAARILEIVRSGEIGRIERIEAGLCFPLPLPSDIRYRLDLAGGATMDCGCYVVHLARQLMGEEPEVVSARMKAMSPGVDRLMCAEVRFPSGATGRLRCSMWSVRLLEVSLRLEGERGELRVLNPFMPHVFHRLRVRTAAGRRVERVAGERTYTHQLRAFHSAVREGRPVPTGATDGVANMRVIDALYRAAGYEPRGNAPAARAQGPPGRAGGTPVR
jgi:predicted dehydrogenase